MNVEIHQLPIEGSTIQIDLSKVGAFEFRKGGGKRKDQLFGFVRCPVHQEQTGSCAILLDIDYSARIAHSGQWWCLGCESVGTCEGVAFCDDLESNGIAYPQNLIMTLARLFRPTLQ